MRIQLRKIIDLGKVSKSPEKKSLSYKEENTFNYQNSLRVKYRYQIVVRLKAIENILEFFLLLIF